MGLEHGALEGELAVRGRELSRQMLQDCLDARAAGERRLLVVAGADGVTRTRAERGHSRPLASVFGEVTVTRIAYRAPGAANLHLADAALNLPAEKHSHGVRRLAAIESARGSPPSHPISPPPWRRARRRRRRSTHSARPSGTP
jgi:hypothetical protein